MKKTILLLPLSLLIIGCSSEKTEPTDTNNTDTSFFGIDFNKTKMNNQVDTLLAEIMPEEKVEENKTKKAIMVDVEDMKTLGKAKVDPDAQEYSWAELEKWIKKEGKYAD